MLTVSKTPENSTLQAFHMKMRYLSHDYASQSYSTIVEWIFSNCINRTNTVHTRVRVTHYMIFAKHHSSNSFHYLTHYQTSYNLIINILTSNMPYQIQYPYLYIDIFYHYLYRYNILIALSHYYAILSYKNKINNTYINLLFN